MTKLYFHSSQRPIAVGPASSVFYPTFNFDADPDPDLDPETDPEFHKKQDQLNNEHILNKHIALQ
jgi:hypothetical protein